MKTTYTCRVQYSDVDASMRIRIANLLNYMLVASDDSVSKTGISTSYLRASHNAAWVLLRVSMHLMRMPEYDTPLEIQTWVERKAHRMVFRNYVIRDMSGSEPEIIGQAHAVWSIINLKNRSIVHDVFDNEALWTACYDRESVSSPQLPHEIIRQPDHSTMRQVCYSDADFNGHLNSCKYVSFMMDAWSFAAYEQIYVDIKYSKELYRSENVEIRYEVHPKKIRYELHAAGGELACSAVFATI